MWVHDFDPVIVSIFGLDIRWYGFMYFLSAIIIYFLLKKRNKQFRVIKDLDTFFVFEIIGMILGARLFYYLIYNFPIFIQNPLILVDISKGGFSFHGAFLGMILFGFFYSKIYEKKPIRNFKVMADLVSILIPLGLFLGRIGNFINGELYGRETTNQAIGVLFPSQTVLRHPSQLYEAFLEGIILFIILNVIYHQFYKNKVLKSLRKDNDNDKYGMLIGFFIFFYSLFRFFVEFFREPDSQLGFYNLFGLDISMGQILSIIFMVGGLLYILYPKFKKIYKKIKQNRSKKKV